LVLLYTERRSVDGAGVLERFFTVRVTQLLLVRGGAMRTRFRATLLGAATVILVTVILVAQWRSVPRFLSAPMPSPTADLAVPSPLAPSLIVAPITLPVAPLTEALERAVPTHFGDIEQRRDVPNRDRASIAFELRRGPLALSVVGDVATLATTLRYSLRAWYNPPVLPELSGSCGGGGDDDPRLRLTVKGPISLGRDWRLQTRSRFSELRPASTGDRDRCMLTFLEIDVTERIMEGAGSFLEAHERALDSIASTMDLRTRFSGWWTTLQEPIPLADSLWLVMRPETVRRGPVRGSGDSLEITLALGARPTVVMGPRPILERVALPPLDTGALTPVLDVLMDARAGYPEATRFLQSQLGGKQVEGMGRTVRLDSLRMFGIGGGRVALEVLVSGDVAARLFLTGTPTIDPARGDVSIPDLDFDVRTRDLVLAAASWLANDQFRMFLRGRAHWPGVDLIDWVQARLLDGLNRDLSDELRVIGKVDEVRILGVVATKEGLLVRAAATGSAELSVVHRVR
jgi:hypothetical protein